MFIKKLYQHSKTTCLLLIGFVIASLFLNYKWGVVATPVLQYGMFSGKFYTKDTQMVAQIYVNDKRLDYTEYSIAQRDMMAIYLSMYASEKERNEASFTTMKRILSKVGVGQWVQNENYVNHISNQMFTLWYTSLLEKITSEKINKLEVYIQKYVWSGEDLTPVGAATKINTIAVN